MRSILKRPYVGRVTREEFVARIESWFSSSHYEHLRFVEELSQFSWVEQVIYFSDSRYPSVSPCIFVRQVLAPYKEGTLSVELVQKATWRGEFLLQDDLGLLDPEVQLHCLTNDLETMLSFLKRIPFI